MTNGNIDFGDFAHAEDGVDPTTVPYREMSTGAKIPAVGLGTFGSDHVSHVDVAKAVFGAMKVGYRHIDCASVYDNEKEIGQALRAAMMDGLKREELWITSKLWNDKHSPEEVIPACKESLKDLQLDYLDLYLVHWPFPNHHPPGCDGNTRMKNAKSYIHEDYMKTWRKMEELIEMGLVKHIGTSNMTVPKLELLLRDAEVKPVCNEMELHPHFQQPAFFNWLKERDIQPIGYSPVGSPARPERDRRPEDTSPTQDPMIKEIAQRHDIHPATLCVKWAQQRGQITIPFSTTRSHYLANLRSCTENPLSEEEMQKIAAIDKNCRLIKGQVFLWKKDQTWEALWDLDGNITPP